MFFTTLTAVMMTGICTTTIKPPRVQEDYFTAVAKSAEQKRPLAVFVSPGGAGPKGMVVDGKLTLNAVKLLDEKYVCVYIDSETEAGKKLAESFEMTEGLIISNLTGQKQVLRHEGAVAGPDLTRYLTDILEPDALLTVTVSGTTAKPATVRKIPVASAVTTQFANPFDPACRT